MKTKILILLIILFPQCINKAHNKIQTVIQDSEMNEVNLAGIWQLDYYPDSIFVYRNINKYSGWSSSYAYNLEFQKDSCRFIGWNESAWIKLKYVGKKVYKAGNESISLEITFISEQKLELCNIHKRKDKTETKECYPYHKVNNVLTQKELDDRIANQIFAGCYKVLFNDTLECDSIICLDKEYKVTGIKDISHYYFETAIDIDFPVPNLFVLRSENKEHNKEFSFTFSGDTLFLKKFKILHDNYGDFSGFDLVKTKIKLLKNK
jgi:hypothetical protein